MLHRKVDFMCQARATKVATRCFHLCLAPRCSVVPSPFCLLGGHKSSGMGDCPVLCSTPSFQSTAVVFWVFGGLEILGKVR